MRKLLFVGGFPSGGTDLTKTVLNAHPDIYINGEMPFLSALPQYGYDANTRFMDIASVRAFQNLLKRLDIWGNLENLGYEFRSELKSQEIPLTLEEVLRICFSSHDRQIWGNKTPQNTENIARLNRLFPDAYFLIVVRDVRDVCLSWSKKWGKSTIGCAAKWAARMQQSREMARSLPQARYLFLKFEDLLSDTESGCKEICRFLEVPFSERMLEHHKYTNRIVDGKINYGQPIKSDNKNKWQTQLDANIVQRIEEIAFSTMALFNYEITCASGEKPASSWEVLRGQLNDALALLLIGNRASQKNSIADRVSDVIVEIKQRAWKF